ncbi:MAG: hypothetical protein KDC46_04775, partial [Thermoleophilia bacterium]|nr:hypothetical protein [Thermoleophilia bacterium]
MDIRAWYIAAARGSSGHMHMDTPSMTIQVHPALAVPPPDEAWGPPPATLPLPPVEFGTSGRVGIDPDGTAAGGRDAGAVVARGMPPAAGAPPPPVDGRALA